MEKYTSSIDSVLGNRNLSSIVSLLKILSHIKRTPFFVAWVKLEGLISLLGGLPLRQGVHRAFPPHRAGRVVGLSLVPTLVAIGIVAF